MNVSERILSFFLLINRLVYLDSEIRDMFSGMPKFNGVPDNRYINRGGQAFTGSLETMERAYDCWKRGRWSDDPFVESVIPSAWDPTVAPPGQHWMSNSPH